MKRILIVEDEYENISDIGERLKEKYEVDVAKEASEAKRYIEKNIYSVVLLDIMLPSGKDILSPPERAGVEVLKIIREKSSETKVVVLTAVVSSGTRSEIRKYKPEEVITKPVEGNILYDLIKKLAEGV